MFVAALFIITKNEFIQWMGKQMVVYPHNGILLSITTWMNHKGIQMNERSQSQGSIQCDSIYKTLCKAQNHEDEE